MSLYKTARKDYVAHIGDTFGPHPIRLKKESFDWTGVAILFQVREQSFDSTVVASINPTVDTTTLGFVLFNLELLPTLTAGLSPKMYAYDVQVTMPTGEVYTVISGKIDFKQDTSR